MSLGGVILIVIAVVSGIIVLTFCLVTGIEEVQRQRKNKT